jgi:hypothetical protein
MKQVLRYLVLCLGIIATSHLFNSCKPLIQVDESELVTTFEKSDGTETSTYEEGMQYWKNLTDSYGALKFRKYGMTDAGVPLHAVILSPERIFNPKLIKSKKKTVILINNAIHPGEPDGIEASKMLIRDIVQSDSMMKLLKDVVIITIPYYNVGGAMNRNSTTRANQNGPKEYGFRGNAQNLDLNRDFLKMDSKNAWAFAELFHIWDPDVFVDTHVSNGADYQHVITNLMTQEEKLGQPLGKFQKENIIPELNRMMKEKSGQMVPYVHFKGGDPDSGIVQEFDHAYYSTGYTALFHTMGFMTETHMLKPFKDRVWATYYYLESLVDIVKDNSGTIRELRSQTKQSSLDQDLFVLKWKLNEEQADEIPYWGYRAYQSVSTVTGQEMTFYNRDKPYRQTVSYYNQYIPEVTVEVPKAYVIPQGWHRVIERLKANNIEMEQLPVDSTLWVNRYRIEDMETSHSPYEGHYVHSNTSFTEEQDSILFRKGDYVISLDQVGRTYLMTVLEPDCEYSFFNWNFFDAILQKKEWFSPYVFEPLAKEYLESDSTLKDEFETIKRNNPKFAQDMWAQLKFIHERSPLYEKAHMVYPVFRIEK